MRHLGAKGKGDSLSGAHLNLHHLECTPHRHPPLPLPGPSLQSRWSGAGVVVVSPATRGQEE